jgi:hypothetical protein
MSLNSFPFIYPLHSAGEGKGEGSVKIFPFNSSLPLRERIKVRVAVKFFPLFPARDGKVRGLLFSNRI